METAAMSGDYAGGCACGAVRFRGTGKPGPVVACHCSQCRRQTGLYFTSTDVPLDGLVIAGREALHWYQSSNAAERGFCRNCGSGLFWQRTGADTVSILAGAFDQPSGLSIGYHIYCADKADFYEINDGLPQYPESA